MHKALDVDLSKDLLRIRSPQLILIGDRGPLGKDTDYASGWKEVRRLNPDAKLIVINGAEGTFLVITHPAEVAKEVIGFLKKYKISA
jgi:pimeloyl-ACP methyl ester carboxylesterase